LVSYSAGQEEAIGGGMTTCPKCGDTKLIPFIKEGKVIPHAFVHCDCKEPMSSHQIEIKPSDYDFPMSALFRCYSYSYCGEPDPGYIPPDPDFTAIEDRLNDLEAETARPGSIPRRYYEQMQQLRSQLLHLLSKVNRLEAQKKTTKQQPNGSAEFEDITFRYMR